MSIKHSKYVWANYPGGKGSHKFVFLALAEFANEDTDECWPSIARLAEMTGLKDRQVQNILRDLKNTGYIDIETHHGRKNTNVYKILLVEKVQSTAPFINEESKKKVQPSTEKVQPSTEKVQSGDVKGAVQCTQTIIETITTTTTSSDEGEPLVEETGKSSDHQKVFEKICDIVGWDHKTLDKNSAGQIAQTLGFLKKGKYGLVELNRFGPEVWVHDWRWEKLKHRPTLAQLRQEIGKLRAPAFSKNGTGSQATRAIAFDNPDEPEYLKLAKRGIGPRQ